MGASCLRWHVVSSETHTQPTMLVPMRRRNNSVRGKGDLTARGGLRLRK